VPKKVCDGGSSSGFGGNFNTGNGGVGDYDYGNYDNGGSNFGGSFNSGTGNVPRTRNDDTEVEVFSEKQINLKSGDAVNFG